jgi:hypothetical protein
MLVIVMPGKELSTDISAKVPHSHTRRHTFHTCVIFTMAVVIVLGQLKKLFWLFLSL